MKLLPPGFQEHLEGGVTTLCWCWKVTRQDGVSLGFTDHDRNLQIGGLTYEAVSGCSASEITDSAGLAVDNLELEAALTSDRLDEASLAAGVFDDASVEIWMVNWTDISQRMLLRKGSIGEVRRSGGAFVAEARGLAHYLHQENGRLFQYACDAELGDQRCKVDLQKAAHQSSGAVVAALSPCRYLASGLDQFAANDFSGGLLTWTTGANAGRRFEVKQHGPGREGATLELWMRPSAPPAAGDAFILTAGCDKTFATCRQRFTNGVNFRGFPHTPGNDFVLNP